MKEPSFLHSIRKVSDWLPNWSGWLHPPRNGTPAIPADLQVEKSGVCFIDGQDELDYLWYRLREIEGGREYAGFRVVRLLQLSFVHLEARSDPGLLQKMRTVLRGLYGSHVSFLYLAAGIFNHQQAPVGIIQCYGVSTFATTLDEACARSKRSLAALKAAMGGTYRQLRLDPLNVRLAEWLAAWIIYLRLHTGQLSPNAVIFDAPCLIMGAQMLFFAMWMDMGHNKELR